MKNTMIIFGILFASAANALPGSYGIKCDSLPGAKHKIHIEAAAADIQGTDSGFPSHAQLVDGAKVYQDVNDDGTIQGLTSINHVTDGVVDLKYYSDKFNFEVWGLPATIRMQSKSDELNGAATFRAHAISFGTDYFESTLKCSLGYSGGSAG